MVNCRIIVINNCELNVFKNELVTVNMSTFFMLNPPHSPDPRMVCSVRTIFDLSKLNFSSTPDVDAYFFLLKSLRLVMCNE